jgi:hypothetical protein
VMLDGAPRDVLASGIAAQLFPSLSFPVRKAVAS